MAFRSGCNKRERTRVLKRLGLVERLKELEQQRLEAEAGLGVKKEAPGVEGAGSVLEKEESEKGVEPDGGLTTNGTEGIEKAPAKKRGRPVGSVSKWKDVQPLRTTRVSQKSASHDTCKVEVEEEKIPRLRRTRLADKRHLPDEMKNARLRAMVPVKMSKLLSKITAVSLFDEVHQTQDSTTKNTDKENLPVDQTNSNTIMGDSCDISPPSPAMPDLEHFTATVPTQPNTMDVDTVASSEAATPQVLVRNIAARFSEGQKLLVAVPVTVAGEMKIACVPVQVGSSVATSTSVSNTCDAGNTGIPASVAADAGNVESTNTTTQIETT